MKQVTLVLGLAVAAALIGAVAWVQFAEPPRWASRDGTLVMDQQSAAQQISVVVIYAVIGLIAGLVIGVVAQAVLASNWAGAIALAVAATAAGIVAWQLGIWWGPGDPRSVPGLSDGDSVADQLRLDGYAPLLAWPFGALIGALVGTFFNRVPRVSQPPEMATDHFDEPHRFRT